MLADMDCLHSKTTDVKKPVLIRAPAKTILEYKIKGDPTGQHKNLPDANKQLSAFISNLSIGADQKIASR